MVNQSVRGSRQNIFHELRDASRYAAALVTLYDATNVALADRFRQDADGLREVLVRAIADSHPAQPADIPASSYTACKQFLNRFDKIYTLSYDLLLYWTLMQDEIKPAIRCDDGFRNPDDGSHTEYVTWEPENRYNQNVFYLHGALHVFDAGTEIQKYTWVRTGVRLIDQIRDALERNLYPLFVAEGESAQKVERIKHSEYLSHGHRSLLSRGGTLFVFGHSLGPSDEHVLRRLEKGTIDRLFIGLHGDPESDNNRRIIARARLLTARRREKRPLAVGFYDSTSARVWG